MISNISLKLLVLLPQQDTGIHKMQQNSALAADSYNCRSRNVYLGCEVALLAERVLVDVNDEFVLQQLLGARTDVPQVIGH